MVSSPQQDVFEDVHKGKFVKTMINNESNTQMKEKRSRADSNDDTHSEDDDEENKSMEEDKEDEEQQNVGAARYKNGVPPYQH